MLASFAVSYFLVVSISSGPLVRELDASTPLMNGNSSINDSEGTSAIFSNESESQSAYGPNAGQLQIRYTGPLGSTLYREQQLLMRGGSPY